MAYVELHCHSAYSFLDGASHPEELALRAAELGYEALALTDHDGVYGSLELAHAAKLVGVRAITGAEITLARRRARDRPRRVVAGLREPLPPPDRRARATRGRRKGELLPPALDPALLAELNDGLVCLSGCARDGLGVRDPNAAAELARAFGRERFYVELQRPFERGDARRNALLRDLAEHAGVETVVTGNVHAHHPRRTALQDVLVAIRHNTSLEASERERRGNRESILRAPAELLELFPDDRDAVLRTAEIAARLEFDLTEELGYRYPDFSDGDVPAITQLAEVCNDAFAGRYPPSNRAVTRSGSRAAREELRLIDELGLAGFFLLHWEVLELARELANGIRGPGSPRRWLPPGRGRGSSVGSIVCYLTGLSHVDPVAQNLSLGRFLNRELMSVPDIDLDFPRDIREQLILGVTERYGREHASLVASFSTYRARGAIRDVGKALGLPFAELERLARVSDGWNASQGRRGARPAPRGRAAAALAALARLRRADARDRRPAAPHLAAPGRDGDLHRRPLVELVPVQPAAMTGRQICQWDKDSCSDAGFLKIDLLGLGMLSAVEDCVEQIAEVYGEPIDLSRIPLDDADVFADIQRADTIGDFQIESRAQMQSLLRTKPENLDDLTVQVALVRPGPIQGKAVHPYIDARERLRVDPDYVPPVDHELLREPLRDTHGVVVFQDQVLDVAMALAGFTIGEAEGLRRAMSRKRSEEAIEAFRRAVHRGRRAERRRRRDGRQGLRQARGLLRLRLPEVARGRVRPARLPVGVAAAPLPGRVPLLAPERAADGLLPAVLARPRRPAAGGGDPPSGRQPQRGALHVGGKRGADGAEVRQVGGGGRRRGGRRRAGGARRVRERRRPGAAAAARRARARGAPPQRRLRPLRQAARPALGARARHPPADRPARAQAALARARPDGGDPRAAAT